MSDAVNQLKVKKRVRKKIKRANPLFEEWLQEWRDEAATKGSAMQFCYAKALKSLKKYPLVLKSGKECAILQNFGSKLCMMIDRRLAEYNSEHQGDSLSAERLVSQNVPSVTDIKTKSKLATKEVSSKLEKRIKAASSAKAGEGSNSRTVRNTKVNARSEIAAREEISSDEDYVRPDPYTQGSYIPLQKSADFYILTTLLQYCRDECGHSGLLTKDEIVSKANEKFDVSLTEVWGAYDFIPWSRMNTLIENKLVASECNPTRFTLTWQGCLLAETMLRTEEMFLQNCGAKTDSLAATKKLDQRPDIPTREEKAVDYGEYKKDANSGSISESPNRNIMVAGSFDVLLLVDTAETSGNQKSSDEAASISELKHLNVNFEVRHLKVGDFLWVCKHRTSGNEFVLPYIVERKRIDDLGKSVKDGRFHEQKFRLKKCGIPNLIYLVESNRNNQHTGLPLATLSQAVTNTQIIDNFTIKFTSSHKQSMFYIKMLTESLTTKYQGKTLYDQIDSGATAFTFSTACVPLMTFADFCNVARKKKRFNVKEMFIKQLVQLHGMSVDKAVAITNKYPSPSCLISAFNEACDAENLLSNITYGSLNRQIGPALSKSIFMLYSSKMLQ